MRQASSGTGWICSPFRSARTCSIRGSGSFGPATHSTIRTVPIGLSLRKLALDVSLLTAARDRLAREAYTCIHALEEAAWPAAVLARRHGVPLLYDMQSSIPEQLLKHSAGPCSADPDAHGARRAVAAHAGGSGGRQRGARHPGPAYGSGRDGPGVALPQHAERGAPRPDARAAPPTGAARRRPGDSLQRHLRGVPGPGRADRRDSGRAAPRCPRPGSSWSAPTGPVGPRSAGRRRSWCGTGTLTLVERQPRSAMPAYLAMADLLVSPRAFGGNLPLKIFDYLAAGRPIVATDISTHRSVLTRRTAVLVEPNADALAEGIISILRDPSKGAGAGRRRAAVRVRAPRVEPLRPLGGRDLRRRAPPCPRLSPVRSPSSSPRATKPPASGRSSAPCWRRTRGAGRSR